MDELDRHRRLEDEWQRHEQATDAAILRRLGIAPLDRLPRIDRPTDSG